jgi:hypothetical protein
VRPMSDRKASDASDEISIELAHVRNTVACELHAQLALRLETIALADIPEVAYAVAVRLRQEFRIEPAPSRQGDLEDDDSLGLDGATFYGSAMSNGDDQGPPERFPIFDHGWPSH